MVGRLSASILEAGLSAAIAEDINHYISLANLLAKVGPRNNTQRVAYVKIKYRNLQMQKVLLSRWRIPSKMLGTMDRKF